MNAALGVAMATLLAIAPTPLGLVPLWSQGSASLIIAFMAAFSALGLALAKLEPPRGGVLWGVTALWGLALAWAYAQSLLPAPTRALDPLTPEAARVALERFAILPERRIALDPAAAQTAVMRGVAALALFWLAAVVARRAEDARLFLVITVHAGAFWCVFAVLVDLAGLDLAPWRPDAANVSGLSGPFVNRNNWASFAVIGFLAGLALLMEGLESGRPITNARTLFVALIRALFERRPLVTLSTAALLAGALMSSSRGGALALALGAAILLWVSLRRAGASRGAAFAAFAALATFGLAALASFGGGALGRLLAVDTADSLRLDLWRGVLELMRGRWLEGVGLGGYDAISSLVAPEAATGHVARAHNDHLELVASLGVIGAPPVYAGFALLALKFATRIGARRANIGVSAALGLAALAALGGQALVDFSLQLGAVGFLFAALLGLCLGRADTPRDMEERPRRRARSDDTGIAALARSVAGEGEVAAPPARTGLAEGRARRVLHPADAVDPELLRPSQPSWRRDGDHSAF